MTDRNDEPRDRSFGPAVQAAVERARNASTDPRWDGNAGGLPEPGAHCICGARMRCADPCPQRKLIESGLRSDTAGTWFDASPKGTATASCPTTEITHELREGCVQPLAPSTVTPPYADPLSPYTRAELERILLDMDVARERLRKLLEVA